MRYLRVTLMLEEISTTGAEGAEEARVGRQVVKRHALCGMSVLESRSEATKAEFTRGESEIAAAVGQMAKAALRDHGVNIEAWPPKPDESDV